ncbi:unnamed protein product [Acanthoscelides obtectus]|uniref:JNK1/MAPK8-associated membrane protein n=1 Tax=Acanthoscelides obtectus TaxID=200917 RepID=A0A9P0KX49_ACAOB|nr:unnamed protein product [Acanthoscelides obtectus]CAK1675812.1 JNK1/MAPK8-associated membrane protein [Acanthoscelides obtectus]
MSCPGWYCGKVLSFDGEIGDCGPCPRGFRRNDTTFICEPCTDSPALYDWLYLGFMVLLMLILHWFSIDLVSMRRTFSKDLLILHTTAFVEVLIASVFSLVILPPFGNFTIHSCQVRSIADWYTLFHNPMPNFEKKLYCTQEAVYPLYTIVFVFYISCLVAMLTIRPWVCRRYFPRQSKMSIYAAMYFIPILLIAHAVIGGLIYYSYPYLTIILSVISVAAHFASKMDQSAAALAKGAVTDPRNLVILLGHWGLHAYGLVAVTQLKQPLTHAPLLMLVPLPTVFYILTARFTDPNAVGF